MKKVDLSDLKVGDKAWSAMHGDVAVTALDKNSEYPIVICLNSLDCFGFTLYGRGYKKDIHPTLFHSKQESIEYWGMESNHLTKRERFAMAAMQGLLAGSNNTYFEAKELALMSIEKADALLTKLNETK